MLVILDMIDEDSCSLTFLQVPLAISLHTVRFPIGAWWFIVSGVCIINISIYYISLPSTYKIKGGS